MYGQILVKLSNMKSDENVSSRSCGQDRQTWGKLVGEFLQLLVANAIKCIA
jgi:hypothetical protein